MDIDEKLQNNQIQEQKNNNVSGTNCTFYLKGICRNGAACKFLHPEGQQGKQILESANKYQKRKECHAYNSGYCPLGKNCKDLHVERNICINYLLGFCPEGPNCKLFHLKTMITSGQDNLDYLAKSIPNQI